MSLKINKEGKAMDNIKHHHIRFKEAPKQGGKAEWESGLRRLKGIRQVTINVEKGDIFVEYDLLECREEAIERCLVETGFVLDDSLMEKIKRGWIHFTEENEQSELKHGSAPCCDVKGREQRRQKITPEEEPHE